MTRDEMYAEVMRRWPAYTVNDVADLTPLQIMGLLECRPRELSFDSMADYESWRGSRS